MRTTLLATLATAVVLAAPAAAQNLVDNPGFETGDFTGWTQGGNTGLTGVDGFNPRSGDFSAYFGPRTGVGTLSQSIATVAGESYLFRFWLGNEVGFLEGDPPSSFEVLWGGTSLFSLADAAFFDYTLYSYNLIAPAEATTIEFRFLHPVGFWGLDDVSVTALETDVVPEPATMTLLATGLIGLAAARRRRRTPS